MSYTATMKSVDTEKALGLLELEAKPNGAYFNFTCPKCEKKAVIKTYGEKKNVWFCPECKAKGHIISLAMLRRDVQYEEAAKFLQEKATGGNGGKITEELKLSYTLEYHKKLNEEGISEETAALFEIGKVSVRWYGLLFALGFLLSLWVVRRMFIREGKPPEDVETLLVWIVLFAILCLV